MNPGIYIITNKINKKLYVGRDKNMPSRYKKHMNGNAVTCRALHAAIKKYGKENFLVEFIKYPGISPEALHAVEIWKINQLNSLMPNGYNICEGSSGFQGHSHSLETRERISKSRKGQKLSEDHKNKISESQKGRTFSEEHKENLRLAWKRRKGE